MGYGILQTEVGFRFNWDPYRSIRPAYLTTFGNTTSFCLIHRAQYSGLKNISWGLIMEKDARLKIESIRKDLEKLPYKYKEQSIIFDESKDQPEFFIQCPNCSERYNKGNTYCWSCNTTLIEEKSLRLGNTSPDYKGIFYLFITIHFLSAKW
jgi:hypothetical protein